MSKLLRLFLVCGLLALVAAPAAAQLPLHEKLVEDVVVWVNDEVILLSDLEAQEQAGIQQLMSDSSISAERISAEVELIKSQTLLNLIWNRLMVQEAERLFDLEALRQDLLRRFMEAREIPSLSQLETMLAQAGLDLEELEERLLDQAAPEIVLRQSVSETLGVSEQEARGFYEEHIAEFTVKGHVVFREIVLFTTDEGDKRLEEAQAIATRAKASDADFVALVTESSEAPSKAIEGKIGPVSPGDLVGEISQALAGLAVGEVSDPIRTGQGWHVIKVEERVEDVATPFEEVREVCEDAVRSNKHGPAFEEFVLRLWDASTIEIREDYLDRISSPWSEKVTVRKSS